MLPEELLKTDVIVKFELILFIASIPALLLPKRCVLFGSRATQIFDKIASKRVFDAIVLPDA